MAVSRPSPASEAGAADVREAGFRYGLVFLLTFTLLVFVIAAPGGAWSRAVALGLEVAGLAVALVTSRDRPRVRRARAGAVVGAGAVLVVLVAADVLPGVVTFVVAGLLAVAIPGALLGGMIRLLRDRGVTLQAVLGALTVYLYVGLLFSWVIAVVSEATGPAYFAEGDPGSGERVYFSFTTLTTTGFGDLTPATSFGHALAVVEMLVGQLYLVTVIGVLVGGLVGRAQAGSAQPLTSPTSRARATASDRDEASSLR